MMMTKHTIIKRLLHWFSALLIIALFISGWIMVDLDYYSPWYTTLPEWHITGGVVILVLWTWMIIRLFFPRSNLTPLNHNRFESFVAKGVKALIYLLVSTIIICGYLFTTADGETKTVLEFIKLPAFSQFSANQVDTMGWLHENLSYVLMAMVIFHVLGALKHHFIDKDDTLKRML